MEKRIVEIIFSKINRHSKHQNGSGCMPTVFINDYFNIFAEVTVSINTKRWDEKNG